MDLNQAGKVLCTAIRPTDLVPVAEAAMRAHLNPFTVWKLIRLGKVRAYGRPGSLRVSVTDLLPEYTPKGHK
jgi:hypothetical protein